MKVYNGQKIGIVVLLVIAVAAVARMKQGAAVDFEGSKSSVAASSTASGLNIPRLLDLGSTSCIPCKMMAPVLEELKTTYARKLQVDFIDVWKDKEAGTQYGVVAIPTQIIFDASGKEVYRHTGFYSKEDILAKLNELGVHL